MPDARPATAGGAITPLLAVVLAVVLLSGALFGYDQGVVSGALTSIRAEFSLSPLPVEALGSSLTFWLFGSFCAIGWVWVYRAVPETRGQSLDQIQQLWQHAAPSHAAAQSGQTGP